jgi:hypothetical protein
MSRDGEAGVGMVEGHAFIPRGEWWTLCRACGLSEAAHTTTTVERVGGSVYTARAIRAMRDDGPHPDI